MVRLLMNKISQMGYLNARYTISPLSYIKASLSQQTYETVAGNENYLTDIEAYGRRTKAFGSPNYYKRDGTGFNPLSPDEFFGVSRLWFANHGLIILEKQQQTHLALTTPIKLVTMS
jgi:hypothetical protein